MDVISNLETLLARGQDTAPLRYGLGSAYLQRGDPEKAVAHLQRAVEHDPAYSAAWKLYGKALGAVGKTEDAVRAYEHGIRVAEARGDVQAAKEMRVFLKRLQR